MNALFYGKVFHYPRQFAKYFFSLFFPAVVRIWPLPKVLSIDETINHLLEKRVSIARFGDGEVLYLVDKRNLPFQRFDQDLHRRLKDVLMSNRADLMVGLPEGYRRMIVSERQHLMYWKSQIVWTYPRFAKYIDKDRWYFNANITRFYYGFGDIKASERYFAMVKQLWHSRKVLLVEGEKSRFGAGNDLLANAVSVQRILGPGINSFDRFHELLQSGIQHSRQENKLILVAMGPTAKVLVHEFARAGVQAIDIGNLDIEYEWYLRKSTERIKIPGKYTSEAIGGRIVEDINDQVYENQIIEKFL